MVMWSLLVAGQHCRGLTPLLFADDDARSSYHHGFQIFARVQQATHLPCVACCWRVVNKQMDDERIWNAENREG
jgi:hypothetical protein